MAFPQILKTCMFFLSKLFSTLIKARICAEKCCKRLQKEMLPDYSCETFFVYNAVHALHLEKAQSLMEELYQFPILFWNTYINRLSTRLK